MLAQTSEIAEEEKVFERKDRFSFFLKKINIDNKKKHLYEQNHISSDFISLNTILSSIFIFHR